MTYLNFFIFKYFVISIITILSMLLVVSFFTLMERKLLAGMQRRHGPVFTGFFGLLQPFADGLKLFLKEISVPSGGYYYIFFLSSILSLVLSLLNWSVIPFNSQYVIADINFGILFILFISSLNVYSTLLSGWSSNSKYGLLGSIRSGAQMISYELPMTLSIIPVVLFTSSFNLTNIINYQVANFWFICFLPSAYVFFICSLAETNRTPFDLPEAESELVAGYNIEYSSIPFAFFFLAEYNQILVMSCLFSILFLGGWAKGFGFGTLEHLDPIGLYAEYFIDGWWIWSSKDTFKFITWISGYYGSFTQTWFFQNIIKHSSLTSQTVVLMLKTFLVAALFVTVRATTPRYKYSQLIQMCWQVFIPALLFYTLIVIVVYVFGTFVVEYIEPEFSDVFSGYDNFVKFTEQLARDYPNDEDLDKVLKEYELDTAAGRWNFIDRYRAPDIADEMQTDSVDRGLYRKLFRYHEYPDYSREVKEAYEASQKALKDSTKSTKS